MSSQLKLRRGSTVSHAGFTGADGEVTFNTDTNALVTHDGATLGGFPHIKGIDLSAPSGAALAGYLPAGAAVTVNAIDLAANVQYRVLSSGTPSLGPVDSIFTATGSETGTGTAKVYLTVQAKLRESVSVKDFGAVGDGVADDTAAIQAVIDAVNAVGGGDIFFPSGVYLISTNLWARNGVCLRGNKGVSELRLTRGVNTQILANQNATVPITVDDFSLVDLIFNANALGTETFAASAVAINGVKRFLAKGCVFKNATGYGLGFQAKSSSLTLTGAQEDIFIEDCVFSNNGHNAVTPDFDGLDFKSSKRVCIKNCIAYGNTTSGFNLRGIDVIADGLIAYDNGEYGVAVLGGEASNVLASFSLSNIHTYNNGTDGVAIATSEAVINGRCRISISNVNSHSNARSGVRFFENPAFPVYGEFEITVNNLICWDNGSHGIENNIAAITALVVSSSVFRANGSAGILNVGSNCVFSGCHSIANGNYGYEGVSGQSGNQFIGGSLQNNLNSVRFSETVNVIGVQGVKGLFVQDLPLAVNYVTVQGRTVNGTPRISLGGPDTNIGMSLSTKGASVFQFFRNNFADEILRIGGSTTPDSNFSLVASSSGRPQLQVIGTATNADVEFVPKGTGKVRFGTLTASVDALVSGYIEVKDSAGTVRKLAVIT